MDEEPLVGGVVQAEQRDREGDDAAEGEAEPGDEAGPDGGRAAAREPRPADRVDEQGEGERQCDAEPPRELNL